MSKYYILVIVGAAFAAAADSLIVLGLVTGIVLSLYMMEKK